VQVVAPSAPGLAPAEQLEGIPVRRFRYAPRSWETLAYTGNMAEDVRGSWRAKAAMGGFMVANERAVRRAVRDLRPDVVHAHWWFPGGLAASFATGLAPLVTTLPGTAVRLARSVRAAQPLFRRVANVSAVVTTVSRFLADEACAVVPTLAPVIAPMPAATELFRPPASGTRRSGLLFVGRLNAQKGLGHLLQALPHVAGAPTLTVVGDGPERQALVALSMSLGVGDRVRWLGAMPQHRLPELYGAASVAAVPSWEEGLGLVAVEALLCETPVVAYRSGGLVDVVEDGVSGRLVPPGERTALASALSGLLADDQVAARMGREGRTRMLSTFAPESVAERYRDIYAAARAAATALHAAR
jgi:glycosyltransferase involved in cell wall biosynthesis